MLEHTQPKDSPAAIAVVHVRSNLPRASGRPADEQDELAIVRPSHGPGIRADDVPDIAGGRVREGPQGERPAGSCVGADDLVMAGSPPVER
jgi:hypothetical protein